MLPPPVMFPNILPISSSYNDKTLLFSALCFTQEPDHLQSEQFEQRQLVSCGFVIHFNMCLTLASSNLQCQLAPKINSSTFSRINPQTTLHHSSTGHLQGQGDDRILSLITFSFHRVMWWNRWSAGFPCGRPGVRIPAEPN